MATFVPPMLAELSKAMPQGDGWVFERKLDGLRCVAVGNSDEVQLWSRNHLSFNTRFPQIIAALRSLPVDSFTLDGEIVAYEGKRTSFALLQRPHPDTVAVFAIFDLLYLLGKDTTGLALTERKALLAKTLDFRTGQSTSQDKISQDNQRSLQFVGEEQGDPQGLLDEACRRGWEGLIAKRGDTEYISGRSNVWRKLKCSSSQELVIAGWTEPQGARTGFGALLVGYFEGGRLRYAGKVGTGFDAALLKSLHAELVTREVGVSPFADTVKEKDVHFAKPELVANITFTEWTRDNKLRHPRFEGLRPDKAAHLVVREQFSCE